MKFALTFTGVLVGVFILLSSPVYAQGLVPCGGAGQEPCQTCHVVMLIDNLVDWLIAILSIVASIIIAYAGIRLVVSGGDVAAKELAKKLISNVIIGYALLLACWLLIDTGVKMLLNDQAYGTWNQIQCVEQPVAVEADQEYIILNRVTASGFNESEFTPAQVSANISSIANAGDVRSQAEAAARAAGITDPAQIRTFVALVHQESSMCRNKVGPETRYGRAYGCGQMLLSTARGLDPSATAERLINDNAYNLSLAARYFNSRLSLYGGDVTRALAAYNGGTKANEQSTVCPGQLSWQCQRNSGYRETRNYVSNIQRVASGL